MSENNILSKIDVKRILLPVIIGFSVLFFLFRKDFAKIDFSYLKWDENSFFWLMGAAACMCFRHLFYTVRLHLLSNKFFSLKKALELIFLWEFSTAILPSSSGGVAASLFFFNKEGLSVGKGIYIMLVNIVLNTIFYVLFLPIFIFIAGPQNVHPDFGLLLLDGKLSVLFIALIIYYFVMIFYGTLIAYGIFVNPQSIQKLFLKIASLPILKRFKKTAENLGNDLLTAYSERKALDNIELLKIFLISIFAWISRFTIIICLFKAFDQNPLTFTQAIGFYAKQMFLYMMSLVSPTPGASGVAEGAFKFLFNEISPQLLLLLVFLWRIFTYYVYLFSGVFLLPQWISTHFKTKKNY
jgi:uncharacterized protein (TIRG00374 family)